MKKLISLLIIVMLLLTSTVVFAAENPSFDILLGANKTQVNPGDEITVVLSIKNINNISEGLWAYQALIQWDSDFLETLENNVEKSGNWGTPSFNPISIVDSNISAEVSGSEGVKADGEVFSIKFKVKDNAETGKNTTITVKNFYASDGNEDIEASDEAEITLSIVEESNTGNQGNESGNTGNEGNQGNESGNTGNEGNQGSESGNTGNEGNQGSESGNTGNEGNQGSESGNTGDEGNQGNESQETKEDDQSKASGNIPQTGENDIVVISMIFGAIALGIISYIGYRKYNTI